MGGGRGDVDNWDFRRVVDPLAASLLSLVKRRRALSRTFSDSPAAASPAMSELAIEQDFATSWNARPLQAAHDAATLLMFAADDHARGLCWILSDPQPVAFAHVPIARAVVEASARSAWLSRPMKPEARVARMMTERLNSHDELRSLVAPARRGDVRRDEAAIKAAARHLKLSVRRGSNAHHVGEERPGHRQVVKSLFGPAGKDAVRNYSLLSAITHSTMYGLDRSLAAAGDAPSTSLPGKITSGIYVDEHDVAWMASFATQAYLLAAIALVDFMGWSSPDWTAEAENVRRLARSAGDAANLAVAAH